MSKTFIRLLTSSCEKENAEQVNKNINSYHTQHYGRTVALEEVVLSFSSDAIFIDSLNNVFNKNK